MRTLNRKVTQHFFLYPSRGFQDLEARWKDICNNNIEELTPEHHLLYAILRGKDYTKGYAEVTNLNKFYCQKACKERSLYNVKNRLLNQLCIKPLADELLGLFKDIIVDSSDLRVILFQLFDNSKRSVDSPYNDNFSVNIKELAS